MQSCSVQLLRSRFGPAPHLQPADQCGTSLSQTIRRCLLAQSLQSLSCEGVVQVNTELPPHLAPGYGVGASDANNSRDASIQELRQLCLRCSGRKSCGHNKNCLLWSAQGAVLAVASTASAGKLHLQTRAWSSFLQMRTTLGHINMTV